jgi:phosphopantothenoylcysteine decarboxylase/phosphopantothenate--cysteine ligase
LALIAAARGAEVTLVSANVALDPPPGVTLVEVGDARDLDAAMTKHAAGADVVVMAAAVADFRPVEAGATKIKKRPGAGPPAVELAENPDILAGLSRPSPDRAAVVVGFAAETGDEHGTPLQYGADKLARKGCDLLVVNRVDDGRAFEVAENAGVILSTDGAPPVEIPFGPKTLLAAAVWDVVARRLAGPQPPK